MWPLVFACIHQTVCPQQAQIAGQSSVNSSGATRSLVPRGLFHQKPRARRVMTFRVSQSQRWQPLLPVTGCSPRCIPSLVLGRPHSKGDQKRLCTANSPCGSQRNFYSGFVSSAWTAGGQTDICASTRMKERRETSCHFSITDMQKKIHQNEAWHCLCG